LDLATSSTMRAFDGVWWAATTVGTERASKEGQEGGQTVVCRRTTAAVASKRADEEDRRPVPSRIRVETAKGRTHGVSSTAVDAEGKAGKQHKQGRNGRGGQVVLALSSFLLVKEAFPGRATGRLQQECMRFLSPPLHRSLSPPVLTLF
jgi:hypothetical protein